MRLLILFNLQNGIYAFHCVRCLASCFFVNKLYYFLVVLFLVYSICILSLTLL